MVFQVFSRGVGRRVLFTKDEDFLAFERVVEETLRTRRMRLCADCLMPNHWHLVGWPERDGDLLAFMQQIVSQPQTEAEVAALRCCVNRGRPFGDPDWVTETAKRLGLEWTNRPRGIPKNES